MENTVIIKILAILKWLIPAAFGSAIAVFIGDRTNIIKSIFMFICGAYIAGIFGAGTIEYFKIPEGTLQACIYLAWGLWGMGIVIQIYTQLPVALANLRDKYTK